LPSSRIRKSDIKFLVAATVAVLMAGFLIAGGILVATRGGKSTVCPQLNIGAAADIRRTLVNGGPTFQTGGAGCGFWLALADNDIVAYKVKQPRPPSDCTLKLKRDHWECDGAVIDAADLAQYPVAIKTIDDVDAVIVDLRPPPPASPTT
jgi:hypothetical protein